MSVRNWLLISLPREDFELLQPQLRPVKLELRQRLERPDRKITAIYFVEAGIVSVVAIGKGEHRRAEVGIVGCEGMTGLAGIFGADRSPNETFVQVEGSALRIGSDDLRRLMAERSSLTSAVLRYAHTFFIQSAHTALANAQGKVVERLARWLLMAHDRIEGDILNLTHEFLAVMLGVRRAGVTTALDALEAPGFISHARGRITILNRGGLEETAKGLYGVPEAELERVSRRTPQQRIDA